jgi:hypothetical protein
MRNFHTMTEAATLAAQMNVGLLCRDGQPMFYAYSPTNVYYERHRAEDVQELLTMWQALAVPRGWSDDPAVDAASEQAESESWSCYTCGKVGANSSCSFCR